MAKPDFEFDIFNLAKRLVRAQAEQDRIERGEIKTHAYGPIDIDPASNGIRPVRTVSREELERQYPSRAQDPRTEFVCRGCGRRSLGTGWFPFCSETCKWAEQI